MNLFLIPSWYPSPQHPINGIFVREQAGIFARNHPEFNLGISHWGQNDERLLLWGKDHFRNLGKIWGGRKIPENENKINENLKEYFSPAFTWSRKIRRGNIRRIVEANMSNLQKFERDFGKTQLIHAHVGYPGGYVAYRLSEMMCIPYIITEHMSPMPFKDFLNRKGDWMCELKAAYENSSATITVSGPQKEVFERKGLGNVTVVNNFIDDRFFNLRTTKRTGRLKCLTIARMVHQKGIDILVTAIAKLNEMGFDMEFLIGGDGESETEYRQRATRLNIVNISWLGGLSRSQTLELIHEADIFILPSRHESFGVVVIEALACGKPCIVTRCGGPEELVSDDVGLVVEKENPEALAEAIKEMAANLDKYEPEKIREYFERNFSSQKTTAKLKSIYEEVVQAYQ